MGLPYVINGKLVFFTTNNDKVLTEAEQQKLGEFLKQHEHTKIHPIKEKRIQLLVSLREAARHCGISLADLSDYEYCRKPIPQEIEAKLSKYYKQLTPKRGSDYENLL